MSQESLLIYKKAGLSEESDWAQGTITPATKTVPLRDSGIAIGLAPQQIFPNRLRGARAGRKDMRLGTVAPALTLPMFGYPVGVGLKALKAALGTVTSTETASFIVQTGVNDKIDFTEDGGAEVTATLAAGTYTTTALAAEIKTKMEAVNGTDTYAVTFSTSTKKFTITKSAGVFVLKWATGTNAATAADSLLGFAADTSSAIAATSATAVEIVYSHAFTIEHDITYGRTKGLTAQIMLASGKVFDVLDAVVQGLNIAYAPNQELWIDAMLEARRVEDSVATLSALTDPSVDPLLFSQGAFTLSGSPINLAALAINHNNAYKTDLFVNNAHRSRFVRGGRLEVGGTLTFDITDSSTYSLYDSFRDDSAGVPLVATFTGGVIKGAFNYAMAFSLPLIKPNFEGVPGGGGADAPPGEVPFIALDDDSNGELAITVTNNEPSV